MLVQHHVKYKEIHGKDEVVMMEWGEHRALHRRLRKEGSCQIPREELHKIAHDAYRRTEKGMAKHKLSDDKYRKLYRQRIDFNTLMIDHINLNERIDYNHKNGNVYCSSGFRSTSGRYKIISVEIQ